MLEDYALLMKYRLDLDEWESASGVLSYKVPHFCGGHKQLCILCVCGYYRSHS